jgi:hypothetical protein
MAGLAWSWPIGGDHGAVSVREVECASGGEGERDAVSVGCCWCRAHAQQRREGRDTPVKFMPRRDAT